MSTNFAQSNSNNNGDVSGFLAHSSYSPADEEDTFEERAYMQQLEEENLRELLARNRPAAYQRYGQHNINNSNGGNHTSSSRHQHQHQSGSVAATVTHSGLSSRSSNAFGEIKSTSSYGYGLPHRHASSSLLQAVNAGNNNNNNNNNAGSHNSNTNNISKNTLLQYAGTGKFGVGLEGITVTAGSPLGCSDSAFPSASASTTSSSYVPSSASPLPLTSSLLPPNRLPSVTAKIRERDQMREQQILRERSAHPAADNTAVGSNATTQPTPAHEVATTRDDADGAAEAATTIAAVTRLKNSNNNNGNSNNINSNNNCSNGAVSGPESADSNFHPGNKVGGGDIAAFFSSAITSPQSQSISDPPPHVHTTRRQSLVTSPFIPPLSHLPSRASAVLSSLSNEKGKDETGKSSAERVEERRGQTFIALTEDNIRTLNISNSMNAAAAVGAAGTAPATNPPPHQRGTTFSTILHEFVNESLASASTAAGRESATEGGGGGELLNRDDSQAVDERGQRRGELWRISSSTLKRLFGKRGGEGTPTTTPNPRESTNFPRLATTTTTGADRGVGGLSLPLQHLRTESGSSLSPPTLNSSTPRGAGGGGGGGGEVDSMMVAAASGTLSGPAAVVGRGDSRAAAAVTPRGGPWIRFPRSRMRAYFGDTPWESLHAQPTLVVGVLATAFIMICTYIMQQYVLEIKDHLGLFAMGSYVNFSSYYVVYFYLEKYSTSFRKISQDKKFYTISNIIKASMLAAITPFAVKHLYLIVVHDSWDTSTLRNLGCVYSIPDFVSLLVVRRMSNTTIFHHVCVVVFNYFSLRNDYGKENVCRCIVVYAAFSTFAYVVNMLLASRFLGVSGRVNRFLALVALAVYVFCCAVNWTWQVHYLRKLILNHDHWSIYMYMILICFVMWDDIVLNRWLLQNFKNTSGFSSSSASTALAHSGGGSGSGGVGGGGSGDMGLGGRRSRGNTVSNGQNAIATTATTSLGGTSTSHSLVVGLQRHTSSASLHSRSTQGGAREGSTQPMMTRATSGSGQLAYRQYSANSQTLLTNRRASEQQPSAGF